MSDRHARRRTILYVLLCVSCFGLGLLWADPILEAQQPRRTLTRFHAAIPTRPTAKIAPPVDIAPAPRPLSRAQLAAAIRAAGLQATPGTRYFQVSPGSPFAANRGAIVFIKAAVVDGSANRAELWPATNRLGDLPDNPSFEMNSLLALWIKAEAAGRRYIVDCSVKVFEGGRIRAVGPGVAVTQTMPREPSHFTFAVQAQDAQWHGYNLYSGGLWNFYGCDVIRL